jgi:uncharacterized protein (DUF4415 family)
MQKGDGLMNTINDKEFDYKAYMVENPPDPKKIRRGPQARQKRREAIKTRITIRIDEEIIEQFKQMMPEGRGYQSLINQALRDWLSAQGVKELISKELPEMIHKAVASIG